MHTTSKTALVVAPGEQAGAPELRPVAGLAPLRSGEAAAWRSALPWEDFAQAWSLAEDRLARLEQQLSSSDLRHCWICRTDFEEAVAMLALQGCRVALEDLVMVDAGEGPKTPTTAWRTACALLSARRHISRSGPARILCCDGIFALHDQLALAVDGGGPRSAAAGPRRVEQQRVEHWLAVVADLQATPPLAAAAIALWAWRDMAPLQSHNSEMGLLLVSTLLWHWGKTKGLSTRLAIGLQAAGGGLHDRQPLGAWIRQFCEAVQRAADEGREAHERLLRGRRRMTALLTRHRANSRLPRLAWLFLSYPILSVGFISRRLHLTVPGSDWLLQELLREKVVEEATGKARNRAYKLI